MPQWLTGMQARVTQIWRSTAAQLARSQQWLMRRRRLVSWAVGIIVVLGLLMLLVTERGTVWSWVKDKETREAITSLLTFAAALAAGLFALVRHFQTLAADRQRRMTETFSKAVEQLSSDKMEERVGGIYTLERLAIEAISPVRWWRRPRPDPVVDLYWTVMETLVAFVRERARWQGPEVAAAGVADKSDYLWPSDARSVARSGEAQPRPAPATDIAAVLEVIRRRPEPGQVREKQRDWRFDLRATDLRGANLIEAHLDGAWLIEAHLDGAWLIEAHLKRADLTWAHLDGANLNEAHLDGASLIGAHLDGADLTWAHLNRAYLSAAHLERADLFGAHLDGAQDLDMAFGNAVTRLPEGVVRPAHWPPEAPERELDGLEVFQRRTRAFQRRMREIVPPAPQPPVERDSKALA